MSALALEGIPGFVERTDAYGETTVVVERERVRDALAHARDELGFNFLSDVAAADYLGWGERGVAGYWGSPPSPTERGWTPPARDLNAPGSQGLERVPDPKPKRFSVAYHLLALGPSPRRLRIKTWCDEGEPVPSVVSVYPTADWHEREAWDMLGIAIDGHPTCAASSWTTTGQAIRFARTTPRRRARPVLGRGVAVAVTARPARSRAPIYEGSRIPAPVPTMLQVDPALREEGDILEINFGPNHPSTHGVLRLVIELNGERIVGLDAVIGYLHTGFEKNMEAKTYWKAITYAPRIDYVAYQNNELAFVLAMEKLLEIDVPPKAVWMRTLLCELNRIHSHLVFLGTGALELGAISMFWYCFREREAILDLFELVCGFRMHTRYFQAGGLAEDIPVGFYDECRKLCDVLPERIDDYEALLRGQQIFLERTKGIGLLSADDAIALGQSGPVLRASGVRVGPPPRGALPRLRGGRLRRPPRRQRRRLRPLLRADRRDAGVGADREPVPRGDARRPVDLGQPQGRPPAQARAAHVDGEPHPPLQAGDRGFPRPRGRGLRPGRVAPWGVRLLPRLGRRPEALARPLPRPFLRGARGDCDRVARLADRRPDRDRRLAGQRHGRGRPVSAAPGRHVRPLRGAH